MERIEINVSEEDYNIIKKHIETWLNYVTKDDVSVYIEEIVKDKIKELL